MFYNRPNYFPFQSFSTERLHNRNWFNRCLTGQVGYSQEYSHAGNWGVYNNMPVTTPEADILELDDQFILEIALPGVVLDDVELKFDENVLTVIAKRTPAMFEERAAVLRKELAGGLLVRHFEFETLIHHEHIEARMERGILFVSLPKVEVATRIPVVAGSMEERVRGIKTRVNGKSESARSEKELVIK